MLSACLFSFANSSCCPTRFANLSVALKYSFVALARFSKRFIAIEQFTRDKLRYSNLAGLPDDCPSALMVEAGYHARIRLDLETNTLFLVRLAKHVNALANVGEHAFLAVGNDELHLSHSIEKESDETRVKCLDVRRVERRHRNALGKLLLQQCLLRRTDDVDLV